MIKNSNKIIFSSNKNFDLKLIDNKQEKLLKKYSDSVIHYSIFKEPTIFGNIIIACLESRICYLGFLKGKDEGDGVSNNQVISELERRFRNRNIILNEALEVKYKSITNFINCQQSKTVNEADKIKLIMFGTEFQLEVWRALNKIPFSELVTYKDVAKLIKRPTAIRATATAIGKNPISYLIPCHRVIQSSGKFGKYYWGDDKKKVMINFEANKK